jgi:hypothetical protein
LLFFAWIGFASGEIITLRWQMKGIWCLLSEQIRHCKEIFEPNSICFVNDYIAAEKALERLKRKVFNLLMLRWLKE